MAAAFDSIRDRLDCAAMSDSRNDSGFGGSVERRASSESIAFSCSCLVRNGWIWPRMFWVVFAISAGKLSKLMPCFSAIAIKLLIARSIRNRLLNTW